MRGTDADDLDLVQLGGIDVDPGPLGDPGDTLLSVIGARELDRESWQEYQHIRGQLPASGWRVVSTQPGLDRPRVVLAAPHPEQPAAWALAYLSEKGGRWFFSANPGPVHPRPGRSARRRHLRLDWPSTPVVAPAGEPPVLSVRLTNTGRAPWSNGPDVVRVLAWILDPGTSEPLPAERYFATTSSDHRPVELAAGQSLVLPALIATFEPARLPPGRYELSALLMALNLRSSVGTLLLT
ncbi:MAG TPA: hypothetical protein VGH27_33775 [Streptosporangiaceae bacterium]|jgi:hypothetical protein